MAGQSELSEGYRWRANHQACVREGPRFASARAVAPLISLLEVQLRGAIRSFGNTPEGLVITLRRGR